MGRQVITAPASNVILAAAVLARQPSTSLILLRVVQLANLSNMSPRTLALDANLF